MGIMVGEDDDGGIGQDVVPAQRPPATTFRTFYDEHVRATYALVLARTGRPAVAEDLTQEAFARAFRDWDEVRTYERPGAWVRTVAYNLAMSRFRRVRAETRARLRLAREPASAAPGAEPDWDEDFWREVRRLPDRQVEAVFYFYVEERSVAEVAAVMGCAEGTVKSHLHRARGALAQRLGEERGTP